MRRGWRERRERGMRERMREEEGREEIKKRKGRIIMADLENVRRRERRRVMMRKGEGRKF